MSATAQMAYGFQGSIPTNSGNNPLPNSTGVDTSPSSAATGASLNVGGFSGHLSNPVFWALVFILFIVGYLGFAFDVNLKRVGSVAVKGGNSA